MAPGDPALDTAQVGAESLAGMLWPLPHRVMVCWGRWKPEAESPVGGEPCGGSPALLHSPGEAVEMFDLLVWDDAFPPLLQVVTGSCIAVGSVLVCVCGSEAVGLGMCVLPIYFQGQEACVSLNV